MADFDFTLDTYRTLLLTLKENAYQFMTFEKFVDQNPVGKVVILRHDVDRKPSNALKMGHLESKMGIEASYYFRVVKESYDENIMNNLVELNHELGYHYEDLSLFNGNEALAMEAFEKNLAMFRQFYNVRTMCMHGSPISKWDNRLLWKKNDYKKHGIIAEPYFDVDFNKLFYITDASRSWNNEAVTLRDKVESNLNFVITNTTDIVKLIEKMKLPDKLMISTHPHNWADKTPEWLKIKTWQFIKNQIKKLLIKKRSKSVSQNMSNIL